MVALTPEFQSFFLISGRLREISETIQLSEVVMPLFVEIKETISISETVDPVKVLYLNLGETIRLSEDVLAKVGRTPILAVFWLNSTAVGAIDSIVLIENIELKCGTLNLSESILLSEDVQKELAVSETVILSEALSVGSAALLPEEFFFLTEEIKASTVRINQESILFSEEISVRPCIIAEEVQLGESITRKFPLPQIEEAFVLSESAVNEIPKLYSEEIELAEVIESTILKTSLIDEVMNLVEQWEAKKNPTDETLKFTELTEAYKNLVEKEISEVLNLSETIQSRIERAISEIFDVSEEMSFSFTGSIQISEGIEFVEYVNRNRVTPSEFLNLTEAIQEKITGNLPDSFQISEIVNASIVKHRDIADQFFFAESSESLRIWILEIEECLNLQEFITKVIYKHVGPDVPIEIQLFEDLDFSEVLERYIMIVPISEALNFSENITLPAQTRLITELINFSENVTADVEPAGKDSARFRFGGKKKRFSHLRKGE